MARADLLCELIKAGLRKDDMTFRRATQAICAEERTKQHEILANKIEQLLKENPEQTTYTSRNPSMHTINSINSIPKHLFEEKMPEKRLEQLLLPDNVVETCRAIIEEQIRADLLRSYGLEPRNKILLIILIVIAVIAGGAYCTYKFYLEPVVLEKTLEKAQAVLNDEKVQSEVEKFVEDMVQSGVLQDSD